MKLLHIDSSILGENAASRPITAAIVKRLKDETPSLEVTYRDLAADPLPHLTLGHMPGGESPSAAQAESQEALDEFLAADIVVIGAPMYNFTIPSQLKAWIDRILIAGKTFRYTENGPEGLAGEKRVIVAVSRGGLYGPESPSAAAEHVESYLRTALGFIGIANPEFIIAEGLKLGPEQFEAALTGALKEAAELKAA
ncbi:FMN-dependent NADH-azoreductase [Hyphococcus sp.]|jgi:FMN-dependent NADH-azoreductase|uniref:FMN-dependent NADH-azoreductase n=1 Tax=Hyphococcus sp. TaxID=2038636 RepID=UPI003D106C64